MCSLQACPDRAGAFAVANTFGGPKLCIFGIDWLLSLLFPCTTLCVWTTSRMPFKGVLAIWLAHWQHVYIQLGLICRALLMWCPCWIMDALTEHLTSVGSGSVYCPRVAPSQGVVSCTYEQWFRPFSPRRRYCHLPVSGRRMQRFLQFRLGGHAFPIATGRLAGADDMPRAHRVCLACNSGAVGDEKHMTGECAALSFFAAATCRPFHA